TATRSSTSRLSRIRRRATATRTTIRARTEQQERRERGPPAGTRFGSRARVTGPAARRRAGRRRAGRRRRRRPVAGEADPANAYATPPQYADLRVRQSEIAAT